MITLPVLSATDILLVLLSPAIGSFLALLCDRLPQGEDVIHTRSHCRSCQTPLRVFHMVPLLSYLALRGRCHHCNAAIPALLPMIEAAAVFIALAVVMLAQSDLQALLGAAYLWCLLALGVIDARYFRLPDPLTAALFLIGAGLAAVDPSRTLATALIAALAASGAFLVLRFGYQMLRGREGLGLGDVKLMAGLGAALGLESLPLMVLIAALCALLWAVLVAWRSGASLQGKTALPFGSFLCLAGGLVWIFRGY